MQHATCLQLALKTGFCNDRRAVAGLARAMATPKGMRAKSIGHYILGKTIGEGTFGKVKLGTHILTGEKVAVKILEKERIVDVADVERVAREIHILKLVQHPHIIQLYEIIETPRQLYLIMEYCPGGELFDYIVAQGRVKEREACRFFHQIMAGVEQIHRMNVVHRDLKPENLLLDEQRNIKIVDFGLSNTYQDGQLLKTACGSPCYAAPEMVAGQRYVPSRCDIWSCGVILFALVCGYLPFEDQNTSALYRKILNADYQAPKFISESARDLIARMLNTDPEQRYTTPKIRSHAWYRQISEASQSLNGGAGSKILEEDVLDQLDRFGFPRDYAIKCLQMGKHNHVTTTYHLLVEKKKRSGGSLKALDQNAHAGFEDPITRPDFREMELPAERSPSPSPFQAETAEKPKLSLDDVPVARAIAADADRAAGGSSPRSAGGSKTPEPGAPNYGNWAFPGQLPGQVAPGHAPGPVKSQAEASSKPLEPRPPSTGHPSRGRHQDMSHTATHGTSTPVGRRKVSSSQAQTPNGSSFQPASGTPTPRGYRTSTPSGRHNAGDPGPQSAREPQRPGTSQGMNTPTRPAGPASSRAQYVNEARRRHYAAPEASSSFPVPHRRPGNTSSRRIGGPAEGAAATAASVAADLYTGHAAAWTSRTYGACAASTTPDGIHGSSGEVLGPGSARDNRDQSMRTCRGAFNVSCTSSKAPKQIMQEIHKALTLQRVVFKQANTFLVRCQKQSLRFEMEISHLDHLESIYVVRFRRAAGELASYKELCSRVLAEMKI
ncbi:KIN10 [Symbiodinium necroappetens]|uniref:non-specific serine/threonine protein kinase n=1 Tax=Symbiodinium necroappetens TaxID=1628268 RepID=A0A813CFF6_9DINO|nr:KIN10 [Symbiodinium necroappetens]